MTKPTVSGHSHTRRIAALRNRLAFLSAHKVLKMLEGKKP